MKKTQLVSLVLAIFVGAIFSGCTINTTTYISEELIIAPNPANPFQGTWVSVGSGGYMHVINGINGEWYSFFVGVYGITKEWRKQAIYTIEKKDDGFMTSNNWRISVTNDILNVENMTYKRVVK
jgi:hypothetical protein